MILLAFKELSIGITGRNLMLITVEVQGVKY